MGRRISSKTGSGDDAPPDEPHENERRRVARVYDRYAANPRKQRNWSAVNPGNIAIRAELAGAVSELAGRELSRARSILDVGCGTGWWLELLAAGGPESASLTTRSRRARSPAASPRVLDGLELLPSRADAARLRVPGARIAVGDARELPYSSASFDVVTLFTVLSSLGTAIDAEQALSEAWRVLRGGGALLVWEPRIRSPLNPTTRFISSALLAHRLPAGDVQIRLTTVAPPLARRLGRHTERLYPRLASLTPLLTHRLTCVRHP
jgi:ubiquinone/menaquinone biosynthesis C-methylase UbiE